MAKNLLQTIYGKVKKVNTMILDFCDRIELSKDEQEAHYESRMALARLGEGMFWLYREISKIERDLEKEALKDDIKIAVAGGILEDNPFGLYACAFQWYAVSACNYAQLVGWLKTKDTKLTKDYVKKVMPRLLRYRNKVAAHYAITDPRRDNEADLISSVMTQIIYAHGRLCAAALTPVIEKDDSVIDVSEDFSWSLTIAHESLTKRYWPDGSPKSYQSIKVPPGKTTISVSLSSLQGNPT